MDCWKREYTPRHVPDVIVQCPDIPIYDQRKETEAPVKKLLMGIPMEKSASMDALRNPGIHGVFRRVCPDLQNVRFVTISRTGTGYRPVR